MAAYDFMLTWHPGVDLIVPVPPNKTRAVQPLFRVADELGKLADLPVDKTSVQKVESTPELKNMDPTKRIEAIAGAHSIETDHVKLKRVLLIDDLYQSGVTLKAVARLLKEPGAPVLYSRSR